MMVLEDIMAELVRVGILVSLLVEASKLIVVGVTVVEVVKAGGEVTPYKKQLGMSQRRLRQSDWVCYRR